MRTPGNVASYEGKIIRFCDGDTIVCTLELGWGITLTKPVRLEGVDSWESAGNEADLCERARRELNSTFNGNAVMIVPTTKGLDRYGRIRGRVMHRGKDIGLYIIENGYGWHAGNPRTNRPPEGMVPFARQNTQQATQQPRHEAIKEPATT